MDILLGKVETDSVVLEKDLKELAAYFIKIGTDTSIVQHKQRRGRLLRHPELNPNLIEAIIEKYQIVFNRERISLQLPVKSLHHIAHHYPNIFIEEAAKLTPGGYDERRFWWCANNNHMYLDGSPELHKSRWQADDFARSSSSRLLSDVLCCILTFDEPKLIAINALHLSVKHSEAHVQLNWFMSNKSWIQRRIEESCCKPEMKQLLRQRFRIREAEASLNTVHVDYFIEWWNLTGLKRN